MPEKDNAAQGLRLNKILAEAGICSRRKADELIRQGLVIVNGKAVRELGIRLHPGDEVNCAGKTFHLPAAGRMAGEYTYLLLHKPLRVVSTVSDPEGRPTVMDYLPPNLRGKRLYPVGRLDFFSEGLLLLTDDGALTERLTHPRNHLPKYYELLVREPMDGQKLATLRAGMTLTEGDKLAPVGARLMRATPRGPLLELTLHQGVNRQIRRMCRDLGLTVLRLIRVGQGPLRLGDLAPGATRPLTAEEVATLKAAVGL